MAQPSLVNSLLRLRDDDSARAQVLGDERCGALFLITQFRVLVDIVTPGNGFGLNSFSAACQALIE